VEDVPWFGESVASGAVERCPVNMPIILFGISAIPPITLFSVPEWQLPESERTKCQLTTLFQATFTV
jgi:hypothetical protein